MRTQIRPNAHSPHISRMNGRMAGRAAAAEGRWQGALIVIGMHAAVMAGLWNYQPARDALASAMPIMVEFITPPKLELPRELPKPVVKPLPTPVQRQPDPLPQIIAAPIAAPAPYVAPPPEPPKGIAPVAPEAPAQVAPPAALPVTPPRFDAAYLDNPSPAYPVLSKRMREQGRVLLRVLVNSGGTAERVELRDSSGSRRLDEVALDTVRRWRFVPAKQGTQAVAAWVLVPISFALEG